MRRTPCFHPADLQTGATDRGEASDYHNTTQQVTQMHYGTDNLGQNVIILYICVLFLNRNALLVFLGYDVNVSPYCYWNKDFTVLLSSVFSVVQFLVDTQLV